MKRFFFMFAVCVIVSVVAFPQFQGKIMGLVTDNAGTPIEGVTVTIVSQKTSTVTYELKTDKSGKFIQVGLMPGYFQVSFKKAGFMPKSTELRVSIGDETKIEVKLDTTEELIQKNISEADKLFLNGNKLYAEHKYQEAVAAFEEAIKLSQVNWGYFFNLGLSYKKMDKKEEALKAFQKAVELNPGSYSSNKELGEVLAKSGNFQDAKTFYQKAVEMSPDDPDAHFNLGACLINTGEPELALSHFQKTVELKSDYADAYYQIGTIYIGQNKTQEAVQSLEKFLEIAPNHEKAALAKQLLQYLKK